MPKKSLTLIKLGGSIITNKDIPMSVRKIVLTDLVGQIAKARQKLKDETLIVGHGSGSFAHMPASKYQTMKGFINEESVLGMAITQDSAAQLNRHVVYEFLRHEIPSVSVYPSNTLVTKKRKADYFNLNIFEAYLEKGLFPITCGDVLLDTEQGCTIWSTEEVLAFLALQFKARDWIVKKIIHVTEVDGVLDDKKEVVPTISAQNWDQVKGFIGSTKGFDVTGGMLLKVCESLELAKHNIESIILSGLKPNNLYKALINQDWQGTRIVV